MSTTETLRPAPVPNPETKPFWDAAREGNFMIKRCSSCSRYHWYPRALCPHCLGPTEWVQSAGRGKVYSYSVTRSVEPPHILAYVTLEEGPTMLTNLVECPLERLEVGLPVLVRFSPTDGGPPVPTFAPA